MKRSSQTTINFPVCRVCLAFDIKMHSLNPQINRIFEKITKTKIHPKDGKPQTVCYICFSLLKRCQLFANMSHLTEGILNQILQTSPMLTRQLVTQHTEGIVSTFYSTPIVACSISDVESCIENVSTKSIVKASVITTYRQSVTMNTEEIDENQGILEMPEVNIKIEQESISEIENKIQVNGSVTKEIVTDESVTVKTENIDDDQVNLEMPEVNIKREHDILENEKVILKNGSVTNEIVTDEHVIVKTENIEDLVTVGTSEVNIKKDKESISENESDDENIGLITNISYIENEQSIYMDNQRTEQEDLELIVTRIAQNIENQQAVFGNEEIVSGQPDNIKLANNESTDDNIQSNDEKTSKDIKKKPEKRKIDDLISELKQEIEDGINAIENEERIEQETCSEHCVIVLSDEDVEMSECDGRNEDNETQEKHKKAKLHL